MFAATGLSTKQSIPSEHCFPDPFLIFAMHIALNVKVDKEVAREDVLFCKNPKTGQQIWTGLMVS